MRTLLPLGLIAAASWAMGRAVLFPLAWPELRRYERLALELTAGVGLTSIVIAISLLTGWFAHVTPVLAAISVAGAVLASRSARRAASESSADPAGTRLATLLLFVAGAVACAGAIPPVIDHDALSYVLPIARHIADARALGVWSDQARAMWPQGNQVLLAYLMAARGDRFGALSAFEWLIALGAISALARRVCTRAEHVPVAIALAIGAPAAAFMIGSAKEEMILLAATAAAAFCLAGPMTAGEIMAAGLFGGIAAAMKYPGLGVAISVVAWAAIARPGRRLSSAALAAACATAAGGLWYALNAWRFGNPVAPFVFGAAGTPIDGAVARELMDQFGGGTGIVNLFVTPLRIFAQSSLYCGRAMLFNPFTYAGLAALARPSERRRGAPLLFMAAVLYAGWYLTLQNARLLLPAAMLLAPLAANWLVPLARRWRPLAYAGALALALPVLLDPLIGVVSASRYLSDPSTYLARETEYYADIQWANTHLDPAHDRLASIFGVVGYFTVPALGVEPTHQFAIPAADLDSDDRFLAACRRAGITHLFATQYNYADVRSQLRVVYENPASRRGGFHFFREPPSDATAIFEILP